MYGAVMEEKRKIINSVGLSKNRTPVRENRTGIPTQLKERMERNTGVSFDDVRVHYNSALPARLDALAYTQGNQVEIAPGQERHLPHELGHVVQQKLGAVRANATHSSGVALNTDPALEHQADEIGAGKKLAIVQRMRNNNIIQRCGDEEDSPKEEHKGLKSDKLVFGSAAKSAQTLELQMKQRGWTKELIKQTVDNPAATRESKNESGGRIGFGNKAIVYYDKTGAHVIVDAVTNEIVQVSDYNNPEGWDQDSRIDKPYKYNNKFHYRPDAEVDDMTNETVQVSSHKDQEDRKPDRRKQASHKPNDRFYYRPDSESN